MSDPSIDQARRHVAKVHNGLVRMYIGICNQWCVLLVGAGVFLPFYSRAVTWPVSAVLVAGGIGMHCVALSLARCICSED